MCYFDIDSFCLLGSQIDARSLLGIHVSTFNFCMTLFPQTRIAIIIQPHLARLTNALPRVSTKEPAALCAARDKPPAWPAPTMRPRPSGVPQLPLLSDDSWRV